MVPSAATFLAIVLLISTTHIQSQAPPATISCTTVTGDLAPCLSFIKGNDKNPTNDCCKGVKELTTQATTRPDRQQVCTCIKQLLSKIGTYEPNRIPLVPEECGLVIVLPPISNKTDCSKVESFI